ncbi:hypothetical protein NDU88_001333 [Pleurodeles waltl]|uniref:Uncharacterized protein n=1 Tax=Pleurodeles waltl TaxID=8319 RepID=A0AAV7TJD8_PLEWA|nr:hypothetical protein NDU88_001333 [Pleurodeles waltl]
MNRTPIVMLLRQDGTVANTQRLINNTLWDHLKDLYGGVAADATIVAGCLGGVDLPVLPLLLQDELEADITLEETWGAIVPQLPTHLATFGEVAGLCIYRRKLLLFRLGVLERAREADLAPLGLCWETISFRYLGIMVGHTMEDQ